MKAIIQAAMKPLTNSLSRHPYLAMLYGAIAAGIAVGMGLEDHWFWSGLIIEVLMFLVTIALIEADIFWHSIVVALMVSLAVPATAQETVPEQPLTSPCVWKAAAAVVVAVGGYVCVKLAKFCQKHFPKKRELPPETNDVWLARSPFSLDGDDVSAAAFNWGPLGSCNPDDPCYSDGGEGGGASLVQSGRGGVATVLEVTLARAPDGRAAFTHRFGVEPESGLQTWEEFQGEVARDHGVLLTGQCCENFYSVNGSPVAEAESRIVCDPGQAIRVRGGLPYRVSVDCSRDLRAWDRLLSIEVPAGSTLRVEDAAQKRVVFYRWSAVPAW